MKKIVISREQHNDNCPWPLGPCACKRPLKEAPVQAVANRLNAVRRELEASVVGADLEADECLSPEEQARGQRLLAEEAWLVQAQRASEERGLASRK